ncbi:MAG: hypothetical protein V3U54_12940 [Thermodesulfobacteriota bacterium]
MTRYTNNIFGFSFDREFPNDAAFETWFEAELIKHRFKDKTDTPQLRVMKKVLGITDLEARIVVLESR